nr:hypothetical protein [Corallococcus coralloides]
MSTPAPSSPAMRNVSGLPVAVSHTGSSFCTGFGRRPTSAVLPAPAGRLKRSPRHSARSVDSFSSRMSRRFS